jgi:S1-C subfamily serine protease
MRNLTVTICLSIAVLLGSAGMSWSADFQKGLTAYNSGDYATALREWRPLAEQGDASAQHNLGVMYDEGQGVLQDYKTAVKWYRLAAKQGNASAQYSLGVMYDNGEGVPEDHKTAVKWYRLAAIQGNADAQYSLGEVYQYGYAVPVDRKTSRKWYGLAYQQWYPIAAGQRNAGAENQLNKLQEKILDTKNSPTVTARKSAPPSSSAAEIENEKLRRENARLRKQKQSIPKTDVALAKRTQEALQVLGLYSGKLDGVIGVRTRLAIRGWQKRNGYSESGKITETQIVKLEQDATRHLAKQQSKPKQIAKRPSPPPKPGSTGSGFFISKLGHIITNEHVVRSCSSITVGDSAKKQVKVTLIETDKRNDLALLKISSTQMASVETKSLIQKLGLKLVPTASEGLLRADDAELGERVLVAGYPYGDLFSNTIKVTGGMVSANKGMGDDSGQFQIDAAVQPGNSGGPIYDENGNIVGVVVAQLNKMKFAKNIGSIPENVNFGIKGSTVRQFLTSSGLPTKWSKRSKRMNTRELAKIAKNQTVMVVCNR